MTYGFLLRPQQERFTVKKLFMSEPTIDQMNEAIALFMNVKPYEDSRYGILYNSPVDRKTCFNLQYHSSWDWLMPVVEKIESLGFCVYIQNDACWIKPGRPRLKYSDSELSNEGKKEAVFKICFRFIQWYNKQQSNEHKA